MTINNDHEVIVGYTTESGHSEGVYGIFDTSVRVKFGATKDGTLQYDKVRAVRNLGHAFEVSQAINQQPRKGTKGQVARNAFDSRWHQPNPARSDDWKRVAAATG